MQYRTFQTVGKILCFGFNCIETAYSIVKNFITVRTSAATVREISLTITQQQVVKIIPLEASQKLQQSLTSISQGVDSNLWKETHFQKFSNFR